MLRARRPRLRSVPPRARGSPRFGARGWGVAAGSAGRDQIPDIRTPLLRRALVERRRDPSARVGGACAADRPRRLRARHHRNRTDAGGEHPGRDCRGGDVHGSTDRQPCGAEDSQRVGGGTGTRAPARRSAAPHRRCRMTIELAGLDPAQFPAVIVERERVGCSATDIDPATTERLERLFHREIDARDAVREIIADVRTRGDAALREWTYRIDGVDVESVHVDRATMEAAWDGLAQPLRNALTAAAQRLREFHALQVDVLDRGAGGAWLHPVPLGRAGCYVPGGRAAYPRTVLMSVIPEQVAGVERVVVASPPAPADGVHPLVAAAAHLLGVREVVAAGGAQAIAAFAFGTESIDRVDKIVGPGNAFVTLAKHEVFGAVGIDQLAGPSEIVVIATAGADPGMVAADLVSQLEHDPLAWAVCLTDDAALAEAIAANFAGIAGDAVRKAIIGIAAGRHAAVVRCTTPEELVALAAAFAPEHLSLQGAAAESLRASVRNAGAVFVGSMSPVSIGDYVAGPNHTLPTQGAARYRGPLAVMDFVRWPSVVHLSDAEFDALAPVAICIAEAEGLAAHEGAIRARMRVGLES